VLGIAADVVSVDMGDDGRLVAVYRKGRHRQTIALTDLPLRGRRTRASVSCAGPSAPRSRDLRRRLSEAKAEVDTSEACRKEAETALRERGEARGVAGANALTAAAAFDQRSRERADAVARFQRFAATGLLLAAWPDTPVPDLAGNWTIDPALTLARRTEQALTDIRHDDAAWDTARCCGTCRDDATRRQ
jgi:hypothetical protein